MLKNIASSTSVADKPLMRKWSGFGGDEMEKLTDVESHRINAVLTAAG